MYSGMRMFLILHDMTEHTLCKTNLSALGLQILVSKKQLL